MMNQFATGMAGGMGGGMGFGGMPGMGGNFANPYQTNMNMPGMGMGMGGMGMGMGMNPMMAGGFGGMASN